MDDLLYLIAKENIQAKSELFHLREKVLRMFSIITKDMTQEDILLKWNNLGKFLDIIKQYLEKSENQISLTTIYTKKILYNLEQRQESIPIYGDTLLPVSQNCFTKDKDALQNIQFDIVFVQGQESHPLRTWFMSRDQEKIWPLELLSSEYSQQNPRIIFVRYDSRRLQCEHQTFNIPDHSFEDLANKLQKDLKNAGVGKRPYVIIPYSMGGIVTRTMLLQHPEQKTNLKGVMFIGSPLIGSDMRAQINEDMKGLIPILNNFMNPVDNAISNADYNQHFLFEGLQIINSIQQYSPLSKMTTNVDDAVNYEHHNRNFLDLNFPYKILIEDKKTMLKIIGKGYYYVPLHMGVLEPHKEDSFKVMKGKNHGNLQQAVDKNDQTYIEVKQFIDEVLNLNSFNQQLA
ncbi:UNKNOWN [Stylonychia lemnae]|uniref:Uncharacterized protein n=1 Tax=Stylonychia lemnae TaxID=5949 RepID=A0A078AG22_STYLE|nr:UNKNOWN [Stylonychia lemnae]|eukprot:CDW81169.1 UNKNOWN [Stylonychia lemnae]